eukprot:CAMPEP_0171095366 /NCGR_PEP_ID=MMETSP0766_2-20121228/43131_1 /TAXON_ID=439317 /ORGANISM="Gambierdiscus australes, Strain CAWD 149" /LENGTH=265 /DNA_ID=CAMNT_0011554163 /DNA_START=48 /DNA_END=845 /DNA_ORIENTATION=-
MLLEFAAQTRVQLAEAKAQAPRQAVEAVDDLTPSTVDPGSDESDWDCGEDEGAAGTCAASPFSQEDTIIIFDWDDTILPSSWMQSEGLTLDSGSRPSFEQAAQLRSLARCAARTLQSAKRFGHVVLVTNAERGWIELSCHKFMPGLAPLLEGLKIVSARSSYERLGVASPVEWKCRAFQSECSSFFRLAGTERRRNVVSLGDSLNERSALFCVTKDMQNCCTKSLKFMEQPDVVQLQREHELLSHSILQILGHDGNLDLRVQVSP